MEQRVSDSQRVGTGLQQIVRSGGVPQLVQVDGRGRVPHGDGKPDASRVVDSGALGVRQRG